MDVDNVTGFEYAEGGSSLTIKGTLTNTNIVQIGSTSLTAATTVTLGGFSNSASTDSFTLDGSASHAADLAFSGGTGFTSNGWTFELTYASPLTLSASFTNSGTFGLHNDTAVTVDGGLANSGTLDVDNVTGFEYAEGGSSLTITGTLANTGTVQVGSTALTSPTTVTLGGLSNSASTDSFSLTGSASHGADLAFSGGTGFTSNGGTFELTYASPLTLSASFTNSGTFGMHNDTAVTVDGGFANSGTLNVDNVTGFEYAEGGSSLTITGTLANTGTVQVGSTALTSPTTVTLGGLTNASTDSFAANGSSATNAVTVTVDGLVSNAGTLNVGDYSVFDVIDGGVFTQTGGTTTVSANGSFSAATIDIDGGNFVVDTTNFTNTGTLAAADGGHINLSAGGLTNLSDGTLTGGTYEVGAGSTLQLPNNDPIVDDDADIILSGAGSTIQVDTSGTPESLDFTLRTISKGGQLHLLDWTGQSFTTAAVFTNDGMIQLGGGRFAVTGLGSSLTDDKGSKLYGFGVVDATTFTNSGLVEASVSGKMLTLTDAVKGKGELQIDAGATLVLAGTTATTNTVTFNGAGGELTLEHVGNLSGSIDGLGLDDSIDLVGVTANGASVNGSDQLVVTENGTVVDTLQLSGNNSGLYFLTQAVSGGTDIVSLPDRATVADYLFVPSLYDEIPGGFKISDTAANVVAGLPTLNADLHVASITITSGSATLSGNVGVNAPAFALTGSSTTLTLDENLSYPGSFSEGAGSTFVLSGGNLLLTGADTFSVETVSGSNHLLETEGATTVSGLTIGGTVEWENTTTVTESGGSATIGDATGDVAFLDNTSTGTYDIADNSGIGQGSSTASHINNAGLIEKTGGTGTSAITPYVINTGNTATTGIEVTAATLDFKEGIYGTGSDTVSGAATLEFDSKVAAGQTVYFTGSSGELALFAPAGLAGSISGFDTTGAGSNDTIQVAAPWVFTRFTENPGGTAGDLGFMNGSSTISLTLIGDYNPADFVAKTGPPHGSTLITYT